MFSYTYTASYFGLQGYILKVEAHIARGLPRFKIVGLPDKSVEESKERVTSAIKNSGYTFPLKRITINLAPSHIPKHGPSLDLPIAIAILTASGQLTISDPNLLSRALFCGELGLDGTIKQIKGIPIILHTAASKKFTYFVIPYSQFSLSDQYRQHIITPRTLKDTVHFTAVPNHFVSLKTATGSTAKYVTPPGKIDTPVLFGCESELRTISISLAGHLNIALYGPPGCGKTLLSQTMHSLLPPLSPHDYSELASIYSVTDEQFSGEAPFRQPSSSITIGAMSGSTHPPAPGEVSLAHHGILFLDEFPEFSKEITRSLKKIIDLKRSTLMYQSHRLIFPADFLLVSAMNLCPCGYTGHPVKKCTCSTHQRMIYHSRIDGALWDRIELHLNVRSQTSLNSTAISSTNAYRNLQKRIASSIEIQEKRGKYNDEISLHDINQNNRLSTSARTMLSDAQHRFGLSTRKLLHTYRIAQTIADLDGTVTITEEAIAEALSYRKQEIE